VDASLALLTGECIFSDLLEHQVHFEPLALVAAKFMANLCQRQSPIAITMLSGVTAVLLDVPYWVCRRLTMLLLCSSSFELRPGTKARRYMKIFTLICGFRYREFRRAVSRLLFWVKIEI
jgi:hypothetical protein